MIFFTADQHFSHPNIISFCGRPFPSVSVMNEEIIKRYNEVVSDNDLVIHAGDVTMKKSYQETIQFVEQLKGEKIFLIGSHDSWLKGTRSSYIFEKLIEGQYVVVCHYAMRTWPRSHYGAWQLFGHSHGRLEPEGKQWDVGVDNNNFYPISFEKLKEIMETRPDNFNLVKRKEEK